MTVSELIAILHTFDPAAEVVVDTYDDRGDAHNVLELRHDDVRPVSMRLVMPQRSRFDSDHDAKLYEVEGGGNVFGVEIG